MNIQPNRSTTLQKALDTRGLGWDQARSKWKLPITYETSHDPWLEAGYGKSSGYPGIGGYPLQYFSGLDVWDRRTEWILELKTVEGFREGLLRFEAASDEEITGMLDVSWYSPSTIGMHRWYKGDCNMRCAWARHIFGRDYGEGLGKVTSFFAWWADCDKTNPYSKIVFVKDSLKGWYEGTTKQADLDTYREYWLLHINPTKLKNKDRELYNELIPEYKPSSS